MSVICQKTFCPFATTALRSTDGIFFLVGRQKVALYARFEGIENPKIVHV